VTFPFFGCAVFIFFFDPEIFCCALITIFLDVILPENLYMFQKVFSSIFADDTS